jgi:hypothetical protein
VGVWYRLVLGTLVTWRVTHLLHAEDGPWRLIARFRSAISRHAMLRQLFDCFYCLSMWVAAPLAYMFGATWTERTLLIPALSGAAILLERATSHEPPMPHFEEDPEDTDGLLRQRSNDGTSDDDGGGGGTER